MVDRVVIPGTYVGTVKLHNAPSATGTNATSAVFTFGLPLSSSYQSIDLGHTQFRKGIVSEQTGTPSLVVIWHK